MSNLIFSVLHDFSVIHLALFGFGMWKMISFAFSPGGTTPDQIEDFSKNRKFLDL